MILNVDDLIKEVGVGDSFASMSKAVFKGTTCGVWIDSLPTSKEHPMGGVIVGAIVEGADECAESQSVHFPCFISDFWNAVETVELDAERIWNETHGCIMCYPETEDYRCVNPDCPSCKGRGEII